MRQEKTESHCIFLTLKHSLLAILVTFLFTLPVYSEEEITPSYLPKLDSLRALVAAAEGEEKLHRHRELYAFTYRACDWELYLPICRDYIAESVRLKNSEHEAYARVALIFALRTAELTDEIDKELPLQMEAVRNLGHYKDYYTLYAENISYLLAYSRNEEAMIKARAMYQEAFDTNEIPAIGIAASCIGIIYRFREDYEHAERFLKEGIELMEKDTDYSKNTLSDAYSHLADILSLTKKADDLILLAAKWENFIKGRKSSYSSVQFAQDMLADSWYYCMIAYFDAYMLKQQYEKAYQYLEQIDCWGKKVNTEFADLYTMHHKVRYYQAIGDYHQALSLVDKVIAGLRPMNIPFDLLNTLQDKADILFQAGHFSESAQLYKDVMQQKDSLRQSAHFTELAELRTTYEVDRHIAEKEHHRLIGITLSAVVLLLLIILAGWIVYSRRLTIKNRAMRQRFEQENRMVDELERLQPINSPQPQSEDTTTTATIAIPPPPTTGANVDNDLYQQLRQLMKNADIYTNPNVSSKEIATLLGTNQTYLYYTLRDNLGMSFKEYINNLRVSYALQLLKAPQSQATIEEIAQLSGFSSRSSFYRNFKEYIGITPEECRKIG